MRSATRRNGPPMGDLDPIALVNRLKSLSPSESEKILGGNAARLLKLEQKTEAQLGLAKK